MAIAIKQQLLSFVFTLIIVFGIFVRHIYAYQIPEYHGPINDYANVIDDTQESSLESSLVQSVNQELGVEIAVVTISSLNEEPIEDVALQFFDNWKIGKAETDSGVLILISAQDQQVRIQTGYGAEAFLTDAMAGRIIRDDMLPHLQKKEYDQAILSAITQIRNASQGIDQQELVNENVMTGIWDDLRALPFNSTNVLVQIIMFLVVGLTYLTSFIGRTKSWWFGGIIGGIIGYVLMEWLGVLAFGIIGLIFDFILSKNYKHWKLDNKSTSWRRTWGGFYSGGKSGGFKFGGGRSGGGGASGRW